MTRRKTTGNTTASRVKSLLLHIERTHGRAEADAFSLKTKLDREYLADETRSLPVDRWHVALVEFASRWGRDQIHQTVDFVVDQENLGVWTRVLRGARDIGDAFRQLDQLGGDDVRTDRWRTIELSKGRWEGAVPLRAVASIEGDGLLGLARATELRAVPVLFGLRPAKVEMTRVESDDGGAELRFVATWSEPANGSVVWGALVGAAAPAVGIAAGGLSTATGIVGALVGGAIGAGAGFAWTHEQRRRLQSHSQLMRIQALERAATLRETQERKNTPFGEGMVVAGEYRLGVRLGAGASGAIYEATRLSDNSNVAIKLLRTAVAHDHLAADRLRREAAALGLAWHPNVVEVYDEGHLPDGTSYLVIERLYGESLADRIKAQKVLSPQQLLPIAMQVCDALGAVHAAGVIHRDVKPSNIFLARAPDDAEAPLVDHVPSSPRLPDGERVKLLDFGVARVEWAETRLTNMGAPLGTPGYMSPEQEQGLEVDVSSDLFSLAAVLYECLTGQAPPARSSDLWSRAERSVEPPSGVQRAFDAIPEPWQKVIDRGLAALPRDRYPDARAMKDAIRGLGAANAEPPPRSEKRA